MKNKTINIAIDGPSAAGKSTIARTAARRLGFIYVDTGALYRSVAVFIRLCGIGPKDVDGVRRLINDIAPDLRYDEDGIQHVYLNGKDITDELRDPEISKNTSIVSAYGFVRSHLLNIQRELAARYNVIMDGRDIGVTVLPNSDLKIFLTADVEVRAKRRFDELTAKGVPTTYEEVLSDMIQRDKKDTIRKESPLRAASGAMHLDTSGLSLEESIEKVINLIRERVDI